MASADLDTSGGLMDQVQALIASPKSTDPDNKNNKRQPATPSSRHPYFKRPGRGHNHDSCDACGEGGNLICCDKCPSSFHLLCHDPPLEVTDIPEGDWLCHSCRHKIKPIPSAGPQTRTKRSASMPLDTTLKRSRCNNPMELLIEAAGALNPNQFELPRSMSVPLAFPGTDRRDNGTRRKPADTQLPAKKCYECRKSCRIAPLVSCDYCSSLYHLDCLDPPLTAAPTGRWMCPNHIEHHLDAKLLTSISATERVRLWDRFGGGRFDQNCVQVEFLRKVHSRNPPFRFKMRAAPRNLVTVPRIVKEHYARPVSLLPSLRDVLRLDYVMRRMGERGSVRAEEDGSTCDEEVETILGRDESPTSDFGEINPEVDSELRQLDERLLKLLALQAIQSVVRGPGAPPHRPPAAHLVPHGLRSRFRHMPMPSELLTPADIERISRVFGSSSSSAASACSGGGSSASGRSAKRGAHGVVRARAMLCPVVSPHFYNVRTSEVSPNDVRHDDSFMGFRPTVSARYPEAVAMRYRVLNVGKGAANDVDLDKFGQCGNVSGRHATIFYDEYTKSFELINYSTHGTYVNNILYCNDTERPSRTPPAAEAKQAAPLEAQVRDIIDKRRKVAKQQQQYNGRRCDKMADASSSTEVECCCGNYEGGVNNNNNGNHGGGWEGSAILNHGSLIRLGCVSFVFSIVDSATA